MLNSKKAKRELNWFPRLTFNETMEMTVEWYKCFFSNGKIENISERQIDFFLSKH